MGQPFFDLYKGVFHATPSVSLYVVVKFIYFTFAGMNRAK